MRLCRLFTTNSISDALSMKGLVKKLCIIFRQHEDLCCACDEKRWSLLIIVVTHVGVAVKNLLVL